jgi:hypothetical protein
MASGRLTVSDCDLYQRSLPAARLPLSAPRDTEWSLNQANKLSRTRRGYHHRPRLFVDVHRSAYGRDGSSEHKGFDAMTSDGILTNRPWSMTSAAIPTMNNPATPMSAARAVFFLAHANE